MKFGLHLELTPQHVVHYVPSFDWIPIIEKGLRPSTCTRLGLFLDGFSCSTKKNYMDLNSKELLISSRRLSHALTRGRTDKFTPIQEEITLILDNCPLACC